MNRRPLRWWNKRALQVHRLAWVGLGLLGIPVCCAGVLRGAEHPWQAGLPNPFFAMDTGTQDAAHQSPAAQAQLVKELGYAGIGWRPAQVPEMLGALDGHGLSMFSVYTGVEIGARQAGYRESMEQLCRELQGRETMIWLYITSKKYGPSDPAGDEEAVTVIRDIAGMAQAAGLKVVLYPHTWFWLERIQDAVRVVRKVDRENVGVTFNLCHCLKVGDEAKIPELLEMAGPHLFLVTVNGADHHGDWDRLIQTLDRGAFDLLPVLRKLQELGYAGPIGLQHYGIKGDARQNLERSMSAWRRLSAAAVPAAPPPQ